MAARIAVGGGALALGALLAAASAQDGPTVDERMPPFDLALSGSEKEPVRVEVGLEGVEGLASYDILGRALRVRWHYRVVGARDSSMCDPTTWTHTQAIALEMWPTEVTALGPRQLLVAGVDEDELLVEQIELGPLESLPVLEVDPATGEEGLPELSLPVISRRTVLRAPRAEGRYISALFQNRGRAGAAFLRFHDSHELHELELATGRTVRIAKPSGPAEPFVLVVPELARRFTSLGDGEHARHGHVYWFYDAHAGSQPVLLFTDADKDGALDSARLVEDWGAELCEPGGFVARR